MSRSWRGRRRRWTTCASSPAGTRAWWAGCWASSPPCWRGPSFSVGFAWRAEHNARQAIAEKREAQFQAYRARLAAAVAALSAHDVADAAHQLDEAPEDLRGWEWRHLHSRLDDSSSVIPMPAGGSGVLIPGPDRLRVGILDGDGLRLTDLEGGELGDGAAPRPRPARP